MQPETVMILDQSLRYALVAFLALFVFFCLYSLTRAATRRRVLTEHFQKRLLQTGSAKTRLRDEPPPYVPPLSRLRPLFRSLLLAAALAAVCFLVTALAPLPFLDNFASFSSWKDQPLRLTELNYERFVEGFTLRGVVWNQTQEPIQGLTTRVTVYDQDRRPLEEVEAPLTPPVIPPGSSSRFELSYERNSPFLYGYRIHFVDTQGEIVPHTEGFDVR